MLRIEPGDSGDSQDELCVRFACRVDASLTINVILLLVHRWRSPQLHLVPGIALSHTRESRPVSQCGCDNATKWKAAERSFETEPSSLPATLRGGKHRSILKVENGAVCELGQLARRLTTANLQKTLSYRHELGFSSPKLAKMVCAWQVQI